MPLPRLTSLISTASSSGSGNPNTRASTAKYRVLSTAVPEQRVVQHVDEVVEADPAAT